jgi:hypothetical protein
MKCPADDVELTKGRAKSTLSLIRLVNIKGARKLTSSTDGSVVHIEFDISQLLELKYKTGDHVVVWHENKGAGITPHSSPKTVRGGLDEALGNNCK